MSYVGSFLGRLPARPAPPTGPLPAMPQGRIGLSSAPPRPPGHPSTPEATQPGPHPMGAGGFDPNLFTNLLNAQPKPDPKLRPPPPADPVDEGPVPPGVVPPITSPMPPFGGIHGNPGSPQLPWTRQYPPGTIQNAKPLTPLEKFLLASTPHAV